ncbi:MAG: hypothetical protein ACR2QW_10090 [bacterium]
MPIIQSRLFSRVLIGIAICLLNLSQVNAQSTRYEEAFKAYQNKNFTDAEVTWIELADSGDVNAQYALGVMHLRQEASDPSPAAAFSWFEKAAAQGHATAMFNLGVAYWEGAGVEQNKDQALTLWEQSAVKGDSGAQFNLGLAYYIGEQRAPDIQTAARWISLAAEQDHPEAKRILGVIQTELEQGKGTVAVTSKQVDDVAVQSVDPTQSSGSNEVETASLSSSNELDTSQQTSVSAGNQRYWKTADRITTAYHKPGGIALREFPAGTPIEIIGQEGGWARFSLPDGLRTWIFSKFITVDGDQGVINAEAVRVRPQPSTDSNSSPPLGRYKQGERVAIVGSQGDWTEIRSPKDIGAWIKIEDLLEYQDTAENRKQQWQQSLADGM